MRSFADNVNHIPSEPCSSITPEREERRDQVASDNAKFNKTVCRHVSSCLQPNIIENEQYPFDRDKSTPLNTRTTSNDTVRSGNEIIDGGINTPTMPSDCGDDVKLVSPPKIGNRARNAANFFDSWSSPHNSGGMCNYCCLL